MKKFKEYGLRKLNSILDYGNLMIITKTPTIVDDDCYNEADGYIEFILLNEFDIKYILEGEIYIHHFTEEDEEYVATYKFRPTQKDIEWFELYNDDFGRSKAEEESICLGDGIEYEEDNEESLENAIDQLMKNIEKAEQLSGQDNK